MTEVLHSPIFHFRFRGMYLSNCLWSLGNTSLKGLEGCFHRVLVVNSLFRRKGGGGLFGHYFCIYLNLAEVFSLQRKVFQFTQFRIIKLAQPKKA